MNSNSKQYKDLSLDALKLAFNNSSNPSDRVVIAHLIKDHFPEEADGFAATIKDRDANYRLTPGNIKAIDILEA